MRAGLEVRCASSASLTEGTFLHYRELAVDCVPSFADASCILVPGEQEQNLAGFGSARVAHPRHLMPSLGDRQPHDDACTGPDSIGSDFELDRSAGCMMRSECVGAMNQKSIAKSETAALAKDGPAPQYRVEYATAASAITYGTAPPTKGLNTRATSKARTVATTATPKRARAFAEILAGVRGMPIRSPYRPRDRLGQMFCRDARRARRRNLARRDRPGLPAWEWPQSLPTGRS